MHALIQNNQIIQVGPERQGTWAPGPATPTVWRDIGPA